MRLFLGLEIPQEMKDHIIESFYYLRKSDKGWTKHNDLHITLLFIGETSPEDIPAIQARMEKVDFAPFALDLNQLEFFNRRILYLGIKPSAPLNQLKAIIDELFPEWQHKETKKFIPHITIKRWQRYEYDDLKKGIDSKEINFKSFEVRDLCLFKSEKDEEDNKYHIIYKRPFQ